jgi:hypothetical protein
LKRVIFIKDKAGYIPAHKADYYRKLDGTFQHPVTKVQGKHVDAGNYATDDNILDELLHCLVLQQTAVELHYLSFHPSGYAFFM